MRALEIRMNMENYLDRFIIFIFQFKNLKRNLSEYKVEDIIDYG